MYLERIENIWQNFFIFFIFDGQIFRNRWKIAYFLHLNLGVVKVNLFKKYFGSL